MVLWSLGFDRWGIRLSFSGPDQRRWKIWSSTRCAERLSFVSIVWHERLLRIVSLSPRVEEPKSEVKKLMNVRTWTTVSSPINVLCISLYLNLYRYRWIEISLWLWYDFGYGCDNITNSINTITSTFGCFSTKMTLTLNKPLGLICHKTKKHNLFDP